MNGIVAKVMDENGYSWNVLFYFYRFSPANFSGNTNEHDLKAIKFLRAAAKYPDGFMVELEPNEYYRASLSVDLSKVWNPTVNEIRFHKMKYLASFS